MKTLDFKQTDHSYYCSESNYYSNDTYMRYDSYQEFEDDWQPFHMDIDMNYIFRFDIQKYEDDKDMTLQLFIIHQRKGIYRCVEIKNIKKEDMPKITNLLKLHYKHHGKMWKEFVNNG